MRMAAASDAASADWQTAFRDDGSGCQGHDCCGRTYRCNGEAGIAEVECMAAMEDMVEACTGDMVVTAWAMEVE